MVHEFFRDTPTSRKMNTSNLELPSSKDGGDYTATVLGLGHEPFLSLAFVTLWPA